MFLLEACAPVHAFKRSVCGSSVEVWFSLFAPRTSTITVSNWEWLCAPICSKLVSKTAHLSVLLFHVTFPEDLTVKQRYDFSPCARSWKNNKNDLSPLVFLRGLLLAKHPKQLSNHSKINHIIILGDKYNNCVPEAGLCSSRKQPVDAFGGSARLSWSEPPSRSNLPKDPPSKTATLHKKDDTDTRIIFKSCGTACSLQHFQRLTANFLLSIC